MPEDKDPKKVNKSDKKPEDKAPSASKKEAPKEPAAKQSASETKPTAKPAKASAEKADTKTAKSAAKPPAKPAPKKTSTAPKVKRAALAQGTYFSKSGDHTSKWRLVDASGQTLGRLSSYVASALMGKDNPRYTRHSDTGDFVVVINAEKIKLTGSKLTDKKYYRHTFYPGGIKSTTPREVLGKEPRKIIKDAVYGMLPYGHMGRKWFKKLKVYTGDKHPHGAQKPEKVELKHLGIRQ